MKLIKNAAGRLVPTEVNGQQQIPYKGINKYKPAGSKAKPPIRTCIDYPEDGNKVVKNLKENCVPQSIFNMDCSSYQEFLNQRRKLMADKMRNYYFGL